MMGTGFAISASPAINATTRCEMTCSNLRYANAIVFVALSIAAAGCGRFDDGNPNPGDDGTYSSTTTSATEALRRGNHRQNVPAATTTTTTTTAATTTTTTATTSAAAVTVDQAIAAAQTPDGRAIPQGPGPNGECPQVLVMLGFWSCPNLGDACSYSAGGASHTCACQRTDGEGQTPSWVCQ
jgi:hypothetical protein